jgi:hypothetical protein
LNKLLKEFNAECDGGSRRQQKDLKRIEEIANRERPRKEDWEGPTWEPAPEPTPMSTATKLVIVRGVLLIAGGIIGSLFTGGGSLAASAAGVAIIAGATAPSGSPSGAGA